MCFVSPLGCASRPVAQNADVVAAKVFGRLAADDTLGAVTRFDEFLSAAVSASRSVHFRGYRTHGCQLASAVELDLPVASSADAD
jgi:hypothetical protein